MFLQTTQFSLRPIDQNAMPELLELYRQCQDFLALGAEAKASPEMVRRDLRTSQSEGGTYNGIYDLQGKLVGVLDVIPDSFRGDPEKAFIELLMIDEAHRGQGLGSAVLAALENRLKTYITQTGGPVTTLLAAVQVNAPRAQHFWETHGFRAISRPALQIDGTVTVMMEKKLL